MATNQTSVPGLNSGLSKNIWWQRSANHVKFIEEYMMSTKKAYSNQKKKKNYNCAKYEFNILDSKSMHPLKIKQATFS